LPALTDRLSAYAERALTGMARPHVVQTNASARCRDPGTVVEAGTIIWPESPRTGGCRID
jgi:hypothetical protein